VARGRTSLYFDLRDGFALPGCAVCRYTLRSVQRFFEALVYENTNDFTLRASIRAARGFCNRHTAQYTSMGDELGAALIYRDLLHTIIPILDGSGPWSPRSVEAPRTRPRRAQALLKALAPQQPCIACQRLHSAETSYVSTLLDHLAQPAFAGAFLASHGLCAPHAATALDCCSDAAARELLHAVPVLPPPAQHTSPLPAAALACARCAALASSASDAEVAPLGAAPLCLPHLYAALQMAPSPHAATHLAHTGAEQLRSLERELGELIRKSDYRFRGEPRGAEATSWLRAAHLLAGAPGVPWPPDASSNMQH
jgi:hypothetical protein